MISRHSGDRQLRFLEGLENRVLQFPKIPTMGSRDIELRLESEGHELRRIIVCLCRIDFVDQENDGRAAGSQDIGKVEVDRVDALPCIDGKKDEIRSVDCDVRFGPHLIGKPIGQNRSDTPGIREFVRDASVLAFRCDAIASDSRFIVNNGDAPTGETVEDG